MSSVRAGVVLGAVLVLGGAGAQSNDAAMNAKIARLSGPLSARVVEVHQKLYAAATTGNAAPLRQSCAAWTADVKTFDPLFTAEYTAFLTPLNWATATRTYEWLTNVTHLAMDLKVVVGAVCGTNAPTRADLLSAYAVASNASALNRQMALQLQTTK
jgi:hypothetical protein